MQIKGELLARQAIKSFRMKSLTAKGPKHVREVLLRKRYLRLHCELDVIQS